MTTMQEPPVLTTSTEVLAAGKASRDDVLHCFERLRRDLARRVEGNVGMFPGFDRLRFTEVAPDVPVYVQVSVSRRLEGSHCVDFVAMAYEPPACHRPAGPDAFRVVALGHGRTLSLDGGDGR